MTLSRRSCLQLLAGAAGAHACRLRAAGLPTAELSVMAETAPDALAQAFMAEHEVPALSVAISRHGQLIYRNAFGVADSAARTPLQPAHLFRIASVSKPFTATAIYQLIEQKKLTPQSKVFGPGGLLGSGTGAQHSDWVREISVEHLLTHTCGGWTNDNHDPMFTQPRMDHHALIEWTLHNLPLLNPPGTNYAYSNFGFCLLGRIIEKLSGLSYADYVQKNVHAPAGITTMRIGGNTAAERAPGEVAYVTVPGQGDPYGMNVRRMDSHGGWIASATDLVTFLNRLGGVPEAKDPKPPLLQPASLTTMTTPGGVNAHYAHGWSVNPVPNWWHNGSLPGTSTLMVRTARGHSWAALTNVRRPDLGGALDGLMWELVRSVPAWAA